ncbi:MAG: ATP-grasp domain-containing protein [Candidatus Omnitrophica bacterium]|nr:ATP-grasp domain-containing protein [Candidatus Omnitrophota bacterium]
MTTSFKIALVHNLKPPVKSKHLPEDYYSECDSAKTVEAIAQALKSAGHKVLPVEADARLPKWLGENPVDGVFNIAEGFEGGSREARVPALLELMGIPYTGSGVLTLALAMDKYRSKQIFKAQGIPTPHFQLFEHPGESLDKRLHFPLMVKPNGEGSAKGIWASSVVWNEEALAHQVARVQRAYRQEVLVEEFIEGTELTVGILGADQLLPVLEIDFSNCRASGESFYSWRMKEFQGDKAQHLNPSFHCPARLSEEVTRAVASVGLKAARALGCRDLVRVDIRLSTEGIPFVLEVNPLPGLDPAESNLPVMAQAAGIPYEVLINRIFGFAMERALAQHHLSFYPLSPSTPRPQEPQPTGKERAALRPKADKANGSGKRQAVSRASVPRGSERQVSPLSQGRRTSGRLCEDRPPPPRQTHPKEEDLGR